MKRYAHFLPAASLLATPASMLLFKYHQTRAQPSLDNLVDSTKLKMLQTTLYSCLAASFSEPSGNDSSLDRILGMRPPRFSQD